MLDWTFDEPRGARQFLTPRGGSWEGWFGGLERRPAFVGVWSGPEVEGYDAAQYRIGGWFVEPIESVVGLRPYDDALEGTLRVEEFDRPIPYSIFEVEKVVRMMLHQSTLAFELLSTPLWIAAEDEERPCRASRSIVRRASSADLIEGYRREGADRVEERAEGEELRGEVRRLATAVALGRGRVSLDLGRLDDLLDLGHPRSELRRRARSLLGRLEEVAGALPESPPEYDALNSWLVERRLDRAG